MGSKCQCSGGVRVRWCVIRSRRVLIGKWERRKREETGNEVKVVMSKLLRATASHLLGTHAAPDALRDGPGTCPCRSLERCTNASRCLEAASTMATLWAAQCSPVHADGLGLASSKPWLRCSSHDERFLRRQHPCRWSPCVQGWVIRYFQIFLQP
jgi:hypothetical protein